MQTPSIQALKNMKTPYCLMVDGNKLAPRIQNGMIVALRSIVDMPEEAKPGNLVLAAFDIGNTPGVQGHGLFILNADGDICAGPDFHEKGTFELLAVEFDEAWKVRQERQQEEHRPLVRHASPQRRTA